MGISRVFSFKINLLIKIQPHSISSLTLHPGMPEMGKEVLNIDEQTD